MVHRSRSLPSTLILLLCITLFITTCLQFANAAAADNEKCTSANLQVTQTTVSPMTGLVLWGTASSTTRRDYKDSYTLEFSYFGYNDVVTGFDKTTNKLTYNWEPVETFLNNAKKAGKQGILRFKDQDPSEDPTLTDSDNIYIETFVPQYIKDSPDYVETSQKLDEQEIDGKTVWYKFPDHSNIKLQEFYKLFFTDFAKRYDADNRLAYLQVGFGSYGEFHVYGYTVELGKNFPSKAYTKEWLLLLTTLFKSTPIQFSIDAGSNEYTDFLNDQDILELNFGNIDDSFMHEKHGEYNTRQLTSFEKQPVKGSTTGEITKRWYNSPLGGEISYYRTQDQFNFLHPNGMYGMKWPDMCAKWHVTYMLANDAPNSEQDPRQIIQMTPEIFKQGSLQTGYRLFVHNIYILEQEQEDNNNNNKTEEQEEEKKGDIIIEIINKGVAPPYMDIYASILDNQSDDDNTSLRGLITNDKRNITFSNINIAQLNTTQLNLQLTSPKVPWNIPYTADCTFNDDKNSATTTMVQSTNNIITMFMMLVGTIIVVIIF